MVPLKKTISARSTYDEILEIIRGKRLEFAENLVLTIIIFSWCVSFQDPQAYGRRPHAMALIMTLVCLTSLDILGVNTTSLEAILTVAGLAFGLPLQGAFPTSPQL